LEERRGWEVRAGWEDDALEFGNGEREDCGYEGEGELETVRIRVLGGGGVRTKTMVTIVKTIIVLDCSPEEMASLRLTRASST